MERNPHSEQFNDWVARVSAANSLTDLARLAYESRANDLHPRIIKEARLRSYELPQYVGQPEYVIDRLLDGEISKLDEA